VGPALALCKKDLSAMTNKSLSPSSTASVTITVEYGYDVHSVKVSSVSYRKFLAGEHFEIKGQGFLVEGDEEQDFWVFNKSESERIIVYCDSGRDIFSGNAWSIN